VRTREKAFVAFCCGAIVACAGTSVPLEPPRPRPMEHYVCSATKDDVWVGVEPVTEEEASKHLFALDLPGSGVVPVYVVVHNRGLSPVLVQKTGVRLQVSGQSQDHHGDSPWGSAAEHKSRAALTLLAPLAAPVFLPGLVTLQGRQARREEAAKRMMHYELPDRTLAPHDSVYGFVFLGAGRDTLVRGANLDVQVLPVSQHPEPLVFSFDLSRRCQ
jgi:hypothetical protein